MKLYAYPKNNLNLNIVSGINVGGHHWHGFEWKQGAYYDFLAKKLRKVWSLASDEAHKNHEK